MRTRLAVVLLAAVWSQASWADVPATLGYSGRLLRTDGGAEVGVAHLTFSIFDVPSGGVALWSEQQALLLSNEGLYSTQLGAVKPLPERLFDAPGSRFLEIAVGDTVLTPRQAIGSVAYALTTRSLKGGTVDATALKVNGADLVLAGKIASGFLNPGPGLEIDATRNALGLRACAAGQVLIWDGPAATWKCGTAAGPAGQSVVASVEPSGVQCATGGLKLVSASGTSYLCNGAPGTSATASPELAGSNCATGGVKVTSASGASYLCNGATGSSGAAGAAGRPGADGQSVTGSSEPAGVHCARGGAKLTSASGTTYVCNGDEGPVGATGNAGVQGTPGAAGLSVTGSSEPAGTNCPGGGAKFLSVSGTTYVCNGAAGSAGAVGLTGAQGPIGATGPSGPQGVDGAPGSAGAVGPQGVAGAAGATGAVGPQGVVGATGAVGPAGPAGPQGVAGAVGATGAAGPQGVAGAVGATGAAGPQGVAGATGFTGAAGPQGVAGATGFTGASGPAGPAGPQGVAGAAGATGAVGPQGVAGATGATGAAGPQGVVGATGATGAVGPAGSQGATGATGAQGLQGIAGATGAVGPAGPQGLRGLNGANSCTIRRVDFTASAAAGTSSCASGEIVMGGGGYSNGSGHLAATYPLSATSWTVTVTPGNSGSVYAVCCVQ